MLEIAKKLAVTSEGFEDVIQEGNMALFLKLTELCGCEEKTDVEAELQGAVEEAMKSSILAEEGEDEDEKAMVGKLALVNEAKKYLAEEKGREATVQELAAYTQLTEEQKQEHIKNLQERMNLRRLQQNKVCPRCGSKLVLRVAKIGARVGHEFYGCSNYPRCRYTENKK